MSGKTYTESVDVSTGSYTADVTTGHQVDVDLAFTERTATEDPAIDVDGDGTDDASYTGVLNSGETWSASVSNLSTGSHTAEVSLSGHQVDVDIHMTERTATEDPGLDLDGDGIDDASYSGVLRSGETSSVSGDALAQGSTTLETSATAGTFDYTVSATGRTHTEDPAIDLGDDGSAEVSHSGLLGPGETTTYELSSLSTSTSSVGVDTTAGTTDVALRLRERQRSTDPAVIINGHRVGHSGALNDSKR
ncbi:hypothetical protein VB773_14265 [Haloarculaceae archaeon H-GB2-1]|nr:hypothetical protein [Haloarculaceae archaeon H-GB2-1]